MMKRLIGYFLVVLVALFGWCCIPMPVNGMGLSEQQTYECCVPEESSTQQMPDHVVCLVSHDGHLMSAAKTVSVVPVALPVSVINSQPQLQNLPTTYVQPSRDISPHSFLVTHCHFLS